MAPRNRRRRHRKSQALENSSWRSLDSMDTRDANLGRSKSMPTLTPQITAQVCIDKWKRAYRSGNPAQDSPKRPEHLITTSKIQAPDIAQCTNTVTQIKAPQYQKMDKANEKILIVDTGAEHESMKQSSGSRSPLMAYNPDSSDSEATIVPEGDDDERMGFIPIALDASLIPHSAFRFPAQSPQAAVHYPPSPWESSALYNRPQTRQGASFATSSSATQLPEYTLPTTIKGMHSDAGMSSDPWSHPSALYTPTVSDRARHAQVPYGLDLRSHHCRNSSRLSSLPAVPSPLGYGHIRKDFLGSDGSGLVPTSPLTPTPKKVRSYMEVGVDLIHPGLSSDNISAPGQGVIIGRTKAFGHWRKETDPFIDYEDHQVQPSGSTFDVIRPPKHFKSEPLLPTHPPTIPSLESFIPPSTRTQTLSIRPPPLQTISNKLKRNLQARPSLDAQKAARENWIRTEAKKIVELHQQMAAACRKYGETKSREDYDAWKLALVAVKDATDRQKRVEERRNLFLPKESTALQTGPEDAVDENVTALPADKRTGSSDEDILSIPQGECNIVRLKMGEVELVSGEVKQVNEEAEDCEITLEMLATLRLDEKRALRQHLLRRMERGYSLE